MVDQIYTSLVSTDVLAQHQHDSDWRIFDCRFVLSDAKTGLKAYQKGHIEGAQYVDLEKDLSAAVTSQSGRHPLPDTTLLAKKIAHWGINQQTQVVVYDDSFGSMAARMWWLLRWMGLSAVALLDGGLSAWNREQKPLSKQIMAVSQKNIRDIIPLHEMWVDTHKVIATLGDANKALIDVRAEPRFLAIDEPIDAVAGHIPGAINIPYEDNLKLDGTYLAPQEIREVYTEMTQGRKAGDIIVMCGSGVTACHSLVALEHAGISGAKLYAGSWSEWIRDKSRPVTK